MTVHETFTSRCPWGCTIRTIGGVTQPHACDGAAQIVDILRMGAIDPGQTYGQIADRLAADLAPAVRQARHASWEAGRSEPRKPMKPRAVKVSDELWEDAQEAAAERGEVLSEEIRKFLVRYVKRTNGTRNLVSFDRNLVSFDVPSPAPVDPSNSPTDFDG